MNPAKGTLFMKTTAGLSKSELRRLGMHHFYRGIPQDHGRFFVSGKALKHWKKGWKSAREYALAYHCGLERLIPSHKKRPRIVEGWQAAMSIRAAFGAS